MRFLGFLVEAFKKSLWFSISGGAKLARVVEPGSCSNQWRAPIIAPLVDGQMAMFLGCCHKLLPDTSAKRSRPTEPFVPEHAGEMSGK
ncbi:hypothetical protein ZEAMMB73_Zm00001d023421 [Zea mays]|uniref:Uncharacterized protein n=1 Tax=Zea mays TaxID=4577 RepID=A0A1D6IT91_MAIZE|nr:hypothetical protein ZEAMMB73_Zm00001d023421 [Zea mays]AQK39289.1 hypothetical protein ZEAMMB73_Zm00001d023421 [Zea mays]